MKHHSNFSKKSFLGLAFISLLSFFIISCTQPSSKDNSSANSSSNGSSTELYFDNGTFLTAMYPSSNATDYEWAVRFPYYYTMNNYVGKTVKAVKVYVNTQPNSLRVKIYSCDFNSSGGFYSVPDPTNGYPGLGASSQINITQTFTAITAKAWNTLALNQVVTIPSNKDLWVDIEVLSKNGTDGVIGIDTGPGFQDADYFRGNAGTGSWSNFYSYYDCNSMIRMDIQ